MNCVFCTDPVQPWSGWGCAHCAPGVGYLCHNCGQSLAANFSLAAENDGTRFSPEACTKPSPPHSFSPALQQISGVWSTGWLTHNSVGPEYCRRAHLDRFLAACPPSSAPTAFEGLHWIAVSRIGISRGQNLHETSSDEERLAAAWNALLRRLPAGQKPTSNQVLNLGRQHDVISGKWMYFAGAGCVDKVWSALAKLVVLDAPENLTNTAKVATPTPTGGFVVICVYVDDFSDDNAVEELGNLLVKALKETGLSKGNITFKPDVYTHLGINTGNPWKIKPTLHIKRWAANN